MAPKKIGAKNEAKAEAKSAAKKVQEPKVEEPKAVEPAPPAPQKRKAEEPAAEEEEEPSKKEPKVEENVEKEKDAVALKGKTLESPAKFHLQETTLNVVPTLGGKMLASLSDGGLQYLIAGARGSVGPKAGRYFFEVRIAETLPLPDFAFAGRKGGGPSKALLRVGFSAGDSPLILGDSEAGIYFDSEGACMVGRRRLVTTRPFFRNHVVGILLNQDPKSENKHTVSLFIDGVRSCQPQPLPEGLEGKPLFPHISFRNVKVQVNFGPEPLKELPFKCHMINSALDKEVVVSKSGEKDGKVEVMLPVAFPDEGTFEWVDDFLARNPGYQELSDRKIIEWAASSGLVKPKTWGRPASNDRPEFNYGLPGMDDNSIRRILYNVAPLMPRNYIVMEVKGNLLESDRKEMLKRFAAPCFKKVAHVVMGEPKKDWKEKEHKKILADKQTKADNAWKLQQAEKKRKKEADKKAKEFAESKKKLEEQKKKKEEDEAAAKKKAEEGDKEEKKEGEEAEEAKKDDQEKDADKMDVDEEKKAEEEDAEKKEDDAMEEDEEDEETEPPKVELTDEEKQCFFAPRHGHDMTIRDLAGSFGKFCLPTKEEGFDLIRWEWESESKAKDYLRKKVIEKKKILRVDDITPGEWFNKTLKAWTEKFAEWQAKAQAPPQESKSEDPDAAKADEKAVDAVEDILDIGNGKPLFKDFTHEDWALLQLRFEMYALQVAFSKDVNDEDRPGVQEAHFGFYYNRYFKKYCNLKGYGVENNQELAKLVKDTVAWEDDVLVSKLTDVDDEDLGDFSIFVKLCETNRRDRQRRLDAGDESARLKIQHDALRGAPPAGKGGSGGGKKGSGKGWKKW